MNPTNSPTLALENRHTGERFALRRVVEADTEVLEFTGSIPAGRASMSVHAHKAQDLRFVVQSGTLHALVGGRHVRVEEGQILEIPRGTPYRFWNEQREEVTYDGEARPAGDLDRYLQAYLEVVNAGERNAPPLTYLARVQLRHHQTQSVRLLWGPSQTLLFLGAAAYGAATGRFSAEDWPGARSRCSGVPLAAKEAVPTRAVAS